MGVYDGANMYLYLSNPATINQLLTYTQAQTGNIGSSTSDVYIGGSLYQGIVTEVMIWGRALSAAEVQALFFQPLTQVVSVGSSVTPPPPPFYGYQIADINNGWIGIIEQLQVSDAAAQVESAQPKESTYADNSPPVTPGDSPHPTENMTKVNS